MSGHASKRERDAAVRAGLLPRSVFSAVVFWREKRLWFRHLVARKPGNMTGSRSPVFVQNENPLET